MADLYTDHPGADMSNQFVVGGGIGERADQIVIFAPPRPGERLSADRALLLAAWIVALADPTGEKFARVLAAVKT